MRIELHPEADAEFAAQVEYYEDDADFVVQASSPGSAGSVPLPGDAPGGTPGQPADGTSALPADSALRIPHLN